MIQKTAIFSSCRKYRYSLSRIWNQNKPYCFFCLLNPSTADENINDPTVSRCMRFASDWGYGGLMVGNIFAFRATDPKEMKAAAFPVGPENDKYLFEMSSGAGITVCGWGNHGKYKRRGDHVLKKILKDPHYLEMTKYGQPGHPLYLRSDLKPKPFLL